MILKFMLIRFQQPVFHYWIDAYLQHGLLGIWNLFYSDEEFTCISFLFLLSYRKGLKLICNETNN